jgi:integrase
MLNKTPGVVIHNGKIRIWFMYNGDRCYEPLNINPTQENIRYAVKLRSKIVHNIKYGTFDYEAEFPQSIRCKKYNNLKTMTFQDLTELWLLEKSSCAKSTIEGYAKLLHQYWLPTLSGKYINEIKRIDLTRLMHLFESKSAKTKNNALSVLKGVFEVAIENELISSNPSKGIKFSRHAAKEASPLPQKDVERILDYVRVNYPESILCALEVAFFTGVRSSELIALKWSDVDFESKILHVQRSKVRHEVNNRTKTYVNRIVQLNSRALAAFSHQKRLNSSESEWIFLNPNTNKPFIDERPLRRGVWNPTLKALGISHRNFYQTRHTCATFMLMSGANPAWCALQLGHDIQVFLKIYAKWINEAEDCRELAKVEANLNTNKGANIYSNSNANTEKCAKNVHRKAQPLVSGCYKMKKLVEAAGIEPASASTPP